MATYTGKRIHELGALPVYKDGGPLPAGPSQAVWNHSPDGFQWGYGGSGPAQLALALLLDATCEETARRHYQMFKWRVVATWKESWSITTQEIADWINKLEEEYHAAEHRWR